MVHNCGPCTSNPLGGAEAEGFGVGPPTPALRATPPERGFSDDQLFKWEVRIHPRDTHGTCGLPDLFEERDTKDYAYLSPPLMKVSRSAIC